MPELPEVETVRRGLAPFLEGRRIVSAHLRRPDLRFPFPVDFAKRLEGARIVSLSRRAKYLRADLDTGDAWITHLGMTGRFTIVRQSGDGARPGDFYYAAPPDPAHIHALFMLEGDVRLEFSDPRRFGYMDLVGLDAFDAHPFFKNLGPEPLSDSFNAANLHVALARRTTSIKAALLDQRVVAGLGNIYVCEALHRAGLSPKRQAGRISAARLERLVLHIRDVLQEAIDAGGSTLRDYAGADGALGYFQHRFAVYDHEGDACPRPGCGGAVHRITQGGRSTFYCKTCQK